MALVYAESGTLGALQAVIDEQLEGAELHLYSNNHTPLAGDTVADYDECTFDGYAAIPLVGWTAPAILLSGKAGTDLGPQTFTAGGSVTPEDVYGIYVTDSLGVLVYAELNPAGLVVMSVPGQEYSYTPVVTLVSEF